MEEIVIRVAGVEIDPALDPENDIREDRCFTAAQTAFVGQQQIAGHRAGGLAGISAQVDRTERNLRPGAAVHGIEIIDKSFHGLEDLIVVHAHGKIRHVAVEMGKRLPAVHVVLRTLQNDGGQGGCRTDAARRPDVTVAGIEPVVQQFAQRDLHAGERFGVEIEVVNVQVAAAVRRRHLLRDQA